MKKVVFMVLSVVAIMISGCAVGQQLSGSLTSLFVPHEAVIKSVTAPTFDAKKINKLAVIVLAENQAPTRLMEDIYMSSLLEKGYSVASRSDIDNLMKEMNFQSSGLTDNDAAKLGKILNVSAVIITSVTNMQSQYNSRGQYNYLEGTVGGRLIDVQKGEVLWLGSCSDAIQGSATNSFIEELTTKLVSKFPSRISQITKTL